MLRARGLDLDNRLVRWSKQGKNPANLKVFALRSDIHLFCYLIFLKYWTYCLSVNDVFCKLRLWLRWSFKLLYHLYIYICHVFLSIILCNLYIKIDTNLCPEESLAEYLCLYFLSRHFYRSSEHLEVSVYAKESFHSTIFSLNK